MDKQYFVLAHKTARDNAVKAVINAPDGVVVEIKEKTRSLEQNSLLWALMTDVSKQVIWHGRKLSPESWKHIFSSSLHKQDVVPNLDNDGFVVIGKSTSKMGKMEFSDMCELIYSFGAHQGVKWGEDRDISK